MKEIWQKRKSRKERNCECCGIEIHAKKEYYVKTIFRHTHREFSAFCLGCGEGIKRGLSFNESRKRNYGNDGEKEELKLLCDKKVPDASCVECENTQQCEKIYYDFMERHPKQCW